MKYEQFKELLETFIKAQKTFLELYDLGFNFFGRKYELAKFNYEIFNAAVKTHYTEEGVYRIDFFTIKTIYGKKDMKGRDSDGNPMCYDMKSTYDYCEQYRFTSDNYEFNKGLK